MPVGNSKVKLIRQGYYRRNGSLPRRNCCDAGTSMTLLLLNVLRCAASRPCSVFFPTPAASLFAFLFPHRLETSFLFTCLRFSSAQLSKPLYSTSFSEKIFPHSTYVYPKPSAVRLFAPRTLHNTFVSGFLLLPSENRRNISGISWSCMIPHLP